MGKCDLEQGLKKGVLISGIGFVQFSNDTGKYVFTLLACVPSKSLAFEANLGAGRWQILNSHPFPLPKTYQHQYWNSNTIMLFSIQFSNNS